ncbi:MAG: hypothetical protein ACRC2K_00625 [Clostridium sp.]
MKKKVLSLLMVATVAFALVGCGGEEKKEEAGNVKKAEVVSGEDTVMVEVKYENDKPVDVTIDEKTKDGAMKSELSKDGKYDMKNNGKKWHEQVDELEAFIKANNFDLSKITYTTEEGNTDAVSGVSIKVKNYVSAVDKAMKSE